jgi:hypothetical protein
MKSGLCLNIERCFLLISKLLTIKQLKTMENIIITTDNTLKIKERAAMLAQSINNVKNQGIQVVAHQPIEGKMFWEEVEE